MQKFILRFVAVVIGTYALSSAGHAGVLGLKTDLLWGQRISAGEPVLVRLRLTNPTAKNYNILHGDGHYADHIYFGVYDAAGRLVGAQPPKGHGHGGLYGLQRLKSGASHSEVHLLTRWYRFDRPGTYLVRARLLSPTAPFRTPLPILAEDKFQIIVGPRDEARLAARSRQLFDWSRSNHRARLSPMPEMQSGHALHALLAIRSETAIPYLQRVIMAQMSSTQACLALRRLRTPRAVQLVKSFAARRDNVGKAARQALKMSLAEDRLIYREGEIFELL